MQNFLKKAPKLADEHHDLLSRSGKKDEGGLLSHLTRRVVDPLELLLAEQPMTEADVLQNVRVEPAMPQPVVESVAKTVVLQRDQRMSQCLLWDMQTDYYQNMGIAAWENSVPCFITSNAFIADNYADLIVAFLRDSVATLDLSQPVYVVEMATGTGRFSSHLVRELQRKVAKFASLKDVQLRYVMTDFTESNIQFWEGHENLQPHIENGFLDFAVLNPLCMQSLELRQSGLSVSAETIKNPLIAIANYFFDSIPVDIFRVENKRLMEAQVTIERNLVVQGQDGQEIVLDAASKPHISQINTLWNYKDLKSDNYYDNPKLNALLNWYRHNAKKGTLLFPLGALEVVGNLQAMSNNRLVLLSSDKAYTRQEHMFHFNEHRFAVHDGAFSYMVNYHGLGRYFENEGGVCLSTQARNLTLQTVLCTTFDGEFENLRYSWEERINRALPITSICEVQSSLYDPEMFKPIQVLDTFLSQIRLALCDPKVFTLVAPKILEMWQHMTVGQVEDLKELMEEGLRNFYFYRGEPNMLFWFGQLYHRMNEFELSIDAFERTYRTYGEHPALYFLMGQNYEKMNQKQKALELYKSAVALDENFWEAREALNNLLGTPSS